MPVLGQKHTCAAHKLMSALPPERHQMRHSGMSTWAKSGHEAILVISGQRLPTEMVCPPIQLRWEDLAGSNCAGPVWNRGSGSIVSKTNRWKPRMTRAEAYRALAERLHAYARKPEAADYVAEFKQLAKCYRLLAESADRKAQFDSPHNAPPLSRRRLH